MEMLAILAIIVAGYIVVAIVIGALLWCGIRLWRWRTGAPDPFDRHDPMPHKRNQRGVDIDREIAIQSLRSDHWTLP